ncbi:MAG: hypothetical protein E7510_14140 [Ruminococcus sp.]|nr:hypothetical protein [Ruminococcus sp.]
MNQENMEELELVLEGTFHQDIDTPEEALRQYIYEVDLPWLKKISSIIKCFLDTNLKEEEKNKIIIDNVEIYFPALSMSPTEWLMSVWNTMNLYINSVC